MVCVCVYGAVSVDSFHSLAVDLLERITSLVNWYLNDLLQPPWDSTFGLCTWASLSPSVSTL